MSNRKVVGTTGNGTDNTKERADYTLELELSDGVTRNVKKIHVRNHSLRSGFLVIECRNSEHWVRASDIVKLNKSYPI